MSDLPEIGKETYIGDGLYVLFDGHNVVLRVPRDHSSVLEQPVYYALLKWVARYPALWKRFATRNK